VVIPHGGRRVYLGTWLDVPVYTIDTLQPAQEMKGPAIVDSATTVLVRNRDRVRVTPYRWLDIRMG
jgi:N-methylhydantoinase A/oxoprolinase/acetone carboxylase beta subunit